MTILGHDIDDDGSPRAALAFAVDAMAAFNDRSGQRFRTDFDGWTWTNVPDVSRCLTELSDLVTLLPLAVRQLMDTMTGATDAGDAATGADSRHAGRPDAAIAAACAALEPVLSTAESLHAALAAARRTVDGIERTGSPRLHSR